MPMLPAERMALAMKRLQSVLRAHGIATARILEQKISDAGPTNQRIDPHVLTEARNRLLGKELRIISRGNVPWYHVSNADPAEVEKRLSELEPIQLATQEPGFTLRMGQALEIAVFKSLREQEGFEFFGNYTDLDEHDDSTLYKKEEPPSSRSGLRIRAGKLDFLIIDPVAGPVGLEVKNIREWLYPDRIEIREMIRKCCDIGAIPVLIGRRIPYVIFSVLNPCGVIYHQTYNQRYASADKALADKARDKRSLGYHDIRVGNDPDQRLRAFIAGNLGKLLPGAREKFDRHVRALSGYGNSRISYAEFAAYVRERA